MADLDRPRSRHAEALEALVQERYPLMVRYAASRLHNRGVPQSSADPEDVVQNALKSVLAVTEPIDNIRAYLYRCINNEIKRAAERRAKGMGYASLDADVRLEDEPVVDPIPEAELRHVIDEAMGGLPLQQRRAMLLTRELGMTQADAARVLGSASNTVGVHTHRAIRALRVTLVGLSTALVALIGWLLTAGNGEIIPAAGIGSTAGAVTLGLTSVIAALTGVLAVLMVMATGDGGMKWREALRVLLEPVEPARPQANTAFKPSSPDMQRDIGSKGSKPPAAEPGAVPRASPLRGPDAPPQ
ncbi:sigma-70 family RNA polymerase sigma factor [Streptomyces sp. NPDC048523]|uniref:sigma-70 family RNA polymerase sigma factor n=1 Tax=Streptomyces sp. NPDC048523 TaxID=3365567 RepID=UPI00371D5F00